MLLLSTALLVALEVHAKQLPLTLAWLPFLAALASTVITTTLIRTQATAKSVVAIRRVLSLLFISTIIWIIPTAVGTIASLVGHSPSAPDEFVLGAFFAWSFELVVINGVFLTSTLKSLPLAAIHPLLVTVTITTYHNTYLFSVTFGLLMVIFATLFLLKTGNLRTANGIASLKLLQAFLAAWVAHDASELEQCFLKYSKPQSVHTEVIVGAAGNRKLSMIIPGVHPGPFSPVGSYNISELMYEAIHSDATDSVVLHGTGGHERNTPTNELASKYAHLTQEFVNSLAHTDQVRMRGPLRSKVGITNITTMLFGTKMVAILSNAPFTSEDLDPSTTVDAINIASEFGLNLSTVDAHNSIGGATQPQTAITKEDWRLIFRNTLALPESEVRLGFANSNETDFKHGTDISEGGMEITEFSTTNARYILVTCDSNNAKSGLREGIADSIGELGFQFIELCTSDTHAFAARSLTDRGYFALGEDTKPEAIINTVNNLIQVAEARLAPCTIATGSFSTELPLVGREPLDDFAVLTSNAISLAKRYAQTILPIAALFIIITLFY